MSRRRPNRPALLLAVLLGSAVAHAQAGKSRLALLVDSSAEMLLTPEFVGFTEACTGWNPCAGGSFNPTAAQESCNACVRDTIRFSAACATSWSASCANAYSACLAAVSGQATCSATMTLAARLTTRGDGTAELPGCDLNGDGVANESSLAQARIALRGVLSTYPEVEVALWSFARVQGGQTCTVDATCPDAPGGLSLLTCEDHDANAGTPSVCALDADVLDGPTTAGFEGMCSPVTWTGAPSTFSCAVCDTATSYDRARCEFLQLDRVRTGAVSPLNGTSTVTCYPSGNPSHRFVRDVGAAGGGACDPAGGQRLVDFPATQYDDNYDALMAFVDESQVPFSSADELRANGRRPLAASLRDLRTSLLAALTSDPRAPCRRYAVALVVRGADTCESQANTVAAAGALQNLSFTSAGGAAVPDYDVPVYVFAFGVCPQASPNCQQRQDLDAIAAAGGTGAAVQVSNALELQLGLSAVTASLVRAESCNGQDDDCDGLVDETFPSLGAPCAVGVGGCRNTGTLVCGAGSVACSATAGSAAPETCNLVDDDCDGLVDDGITCQGCVPACAPSAGCDLCDGRDDDCDGVFDEDFVPVSCGAALGVCAGGLTTCVAGEVRCGGTPPSAESCNALDDDCDGMVDSFTSRCYPVDAGGCDLDAGRCTGACRLGSRTCDGGVEGACVGAVVPSPEVSCNLVDEDCDGVVRASGGQPEQCNGLDDDCDGQVDEDVDVTDPDLGQACGQGPGDGGCGGGTLRCVAGAEVCTGAVAPRDEACNGLDEDCDGTIDDGASCGDVGQACVQGACRVVCGPGPFPCGAGETCGTLDGGSPLVKVCVPDPCGARTCPSGQACDPSTGQCTSLCAAVLCAPGKACHEGSCVDCRALPSLCAAGQLCAPDSMGVGQCVADPCAAGPCGAGETCVTTQDLRAVCVGAPAPAPRGCGCASAPGGLAALGVVLLGLRRRRRGPLALALAALLGACTPAAPAAPDAGPYDAFDAGPPGCLPTAEVCNGLDDDCDGVVDDGFDLQADPAHCGACGNRCAFPNARGACDAGACEQVGCAPGFSDVDASTPGCEAACVTSNGGVERCNGLDDDCDGTVDDGDPDGGAACGSAVGACAQGTLHCQSGALACVGGTAPLAETCNGLDDDCDGQADETFDTLTDPRFCENCAGCALPHADPLCQSGACAIGRCHEGWSNLDGLVATGCETPCVATGPEVCNGLDDDCDGVVDSPDGGLAPPPGLCRTAGECAGSSATCRGDAGWGCNYPDPDVELRADGTLALEETRCDGRDNDCDGVPDEAFPLKGVACSEDGTFGTVRRLGACRGAGQLVCNTLGAGLRCLVTTAGATPANETCNGRDDDCDGLVDEPFDYGSFSGVRDVVVGPLTVGGQSVVMYRYEASRPDSTAISAGASGARACSVSGRMPWANVDYAQALSACQGAGMRLCRVTRNAGGQVTSDEWGRYCEGAANLLWPYGNGYSATACNGSDYDPVPGGVNEDVAIPTGTLATCQSPDLARDQSGNLAEWVDDPRTVSGQTVHTVRGGAFDGQSMGLSCDWDLRTTPLTTSMESVGFRCCGRACPAGQSECSGACVNLASSNVNCGACGAVCGSGTACSNGRCCPTGTRACGDVCVPTAQACP